jgi:hypothetical protein
MKRRLTRLSLTAVLLLAIIVAVQSQQGSLATDRPQLERYPLFLPVASSGRAVPAVGAVDDQELRAYTHPVWGLTFDYPTGWTPEIPDFDALATPPPDLPPPYTYEPDIEYLRTLGHQITLRGPAGSGPGASEIIIGPSGFTWSDTFPFSEWVNLYHEFSAIENPLANETQVYTRPLTLPISPELDDVIHDVTENRLLQVDVFWLAKGELVFMVMTYNPTPEMDALLQRLVSSIRFDADKLESFRRTARFSGNEEQIRQTIEMLLPPTPQE